MFEIAMQPSAGVLPVHTADQLETLATPGNELPNLGQTDDGQRPPPPNK
jgi:hypothetical protein